MTARACLHCGGPEIRGVCRGCGPKPRPSTTERGYGYSHQKARGEAARVVAAGVAFCPRCGKPIKPGEPFDLDHTEDRRGYLGVSHPKCNRRAGERRAS